MLLRWRILEEEVLCGVPVHWEVSGSPAAVAVLVRALGEAVLFGGVIALLLVLVLVLVLGVVLVLTLSLAVVSVLRC
jgi:anti-sigma factor RsiW